MSAERPPEQRHGTGDIVGPHHIGLHVSSLDTSLAFYAELLGFEIAFRWAPDAPYIAELLGEPDARMEAAILRLPNSDIVLELVEFKHRRADRADARSAVPGTTHIGLAVQGVDRLHQRLVDAGVKSISAPVTPTMGPNMNGRVVFVLDPDGVRIELTESSRWLHQYRPSDDR
jgi:lactoylglutathione lyase